MTTPHQGPAARPRSTKAGLNRAGVAFLVLGTIALPTSLLGLVLSANACGMFADGCEDYGKPALAAPWFGLLLLAAILAIVAGTTMLVIAASYRRRARWQQAMEAVDTIRNPRSS